MSRGGSGGFIPEVRAVVDGKDVNPEDLVLDPLRWEGEKSRGSDQLGPRRKALLVLSLDGNDLRALGKKLVQFHADYVREDEDFFSKPHMEDVPRPLSVDLFLHDPLSLKRYFAKDSFWRRKAGEALVAVANPFRSGQARWFVEGYRSVKVADGMLVFELSVRGY